MSLTGCSQNLPENYGIYANTDKGRTTLSGQKVSFTGNLLQSITGVKGPSGVECNSIKDFIIFEKEINPKYVRISKLEFKKGGYIDSFMGKSYVDVNLWVAAGNVEFDVAPIDGKKDMYRLTPKTTLNNGFYALHFGGLENDSTIEASTGNMAHDFVIGKKSDYPNPEEKKMLEEKARVDNQEMVRTEADMLLKTMNEAFNSKDYAKIKDIYRPNGNVFSTDSEWQEFTKGLATWLGDAGRIKESKIVTVMSIGEEEGTFAVETEYEKKGKQSERLAIRKIDGKFFVTAME